MVETTIRSSVLIRAASPDEASVVLKIMLEAYEEYRYASPPSSALKETEASIREEMTNGDKAAIAFFDQTPVATVRYRFENGLYFRRLAVRPAYRGRGIGRVVLQWLEGEAAMNNETSVWCRVRSSVPRNVALYQRLGYSIEKEEVEANPNGDPVRVAYMRKSLLPGDS
jgi:GNAT superfamily N-acetyltransferase